MMSNRIIIVTTQAFNQKNKANYFLCEFEQRGINLEFWDVFDCFYNIPHIREEIPLEKGKRIKKIKHLVKEINAQPNNKIIFIIYLPHQIKGIKAKHFIFKKAKKVVKIDYNKALSQFTGTDVSSRSVMKYLQKPKYTLNSLILKILNRLFEMYHRNKKCIEFSTGRSAPDKHSITYDDFYTFKNIQLKQRIVENEYIVFLDGYLPHHIDFKVHNIETLNASSYYKKLNSFFDSLEQKYGLTVVIAAHPKSAYTTEYNNRLVIKDKTSELIRDCTFVLNHYSSAITFAVLFNKPIMYFYTDDFLTKNTFLNTIYQRILHQSSYFELHHYNIDRPIKLPSEFKVNASRYRAFLEDFTISRQFPKTNFEIISEEILQ